MLVTVLLIGGLLWVMIGSVTESTLEGDLRYSMNLVFLVLIAVTALVVMFVRRKIEEASSLQQKSIYTLLAWASAEGIAILGANWAISISRV